MKRTCLIVMLTLGLATMVSAQTRRATNRPAGPAAAPAETALKNIEHQLNDALKNKDRVGLLRLLDDQYTFTDDEGRVFTKNQYIEAAASTINVESYSLDEITVRLFGDTAVVTGGWTGTFSVAGKDASGSFRYTDTFVKRAMRWRAIASQISRQAPPQMTTSSGLRYIDLKVGTGESPTSGQMVTVHYTGTLENGTKFDSSVDRCQPFTFPIGIGKVIKGWDEGVMTMKVGGKRRLIIPPELGYGSRGAGNVIPPNATLIFDVELLGLK
jgi:ketosteroid isomerase-like protein